MDTVLNSLEEKLLRLSEIAAGEPAPRPLNVAAVMTHITHVRAVAATNAESLRLFAGVGFLAAAAAVLVLVFAVPAWSDMSNPAVAMDSLMDVIASSSIIDEVLSQ